MQGLDTNQIDQISDLVAQYICYQRDQFEPRASVLSPVQRSAMTGFFRADLLESTRILQMEQHRIPNPSFYPMLRDFGFSNLPDFGQMAAVTFRDVVVSHEVVSDGLLFHELVHVEQYRQLGVSRFAELYVRGFLFGGGYDGIPLEINAYALGDRFESFPDQPFSVESEVSLWNREGRF